MGWGLIIKDVYVNRVRKDQLPDKIEETKEMIEHLEDGIKALAFGQPRDVQSEGGQFTPWEDYAPPALRDILDGLKDMYIKQYLYELAADDLNEVEEDN